MLFVVHEELTPYCESAGGVEIEGLQNLLLAARRGEHALVVPFQALTALSKNSALGSRERSMAKHLLSRRSEMGQLVSMVQRKVVVRLHANGTSLWRINDDWNIAIQELAARYTSRAALLAENMVDAELYCIAGIHYRIDKKIKGIDLSLMHRGGGGSQMDVELKASLQSGIATVAISDGDKHHPDQLSGPVALRCEYVSKSGIGVCWHYSLDCYSAENLIPVQVYIDACQHEERHAELDRVMSVSVGSISKGKDASKYFSWKQGLTLAEILSFSDNEKRKFWIQTVGSIERYNHAFSNCLENEECSTDPCECVIAKGFGGNCLRQVKDWCESRSAHESKKVFQSAPEWMHLGRMVFEVGMAFPPQRL